MSNTGIIYGVNGPVIYLKGDSGFKISEMVYVGPEHLVGEIIGLKKGMTTVQVFEETTGLKPGDTVTGTGDAISVLLGPGIIHNIFDGIQRPLEEIAKASGWMNDIADGLKTSVTGWDWAGLLMISFILPAILCPLINMFIRKLGWVKDGDMTLS